MRSYCITQGTISSLLGKTMMEDNIGKGNIYIYIYIYIIYIYLQVSKALFGIRSTPSCCIDIVSLSNLDHVPPLLNIQQMSTSLPPRPPVMDFSLSTSSISSLALFH